MAVRKADLPVPASVDHSLFVHPSKHNANRVDTIPDNRFVATSAGVMQVSGRNPKCNVDLRVRDSVADHDRICGRESQAIVALNSRNADCGDSSSVNLVQIPPVVAHRNVLTVIVLDRIQGRKTEDLRRRT